MSVLQPPGEQELATRQDVQRVDEKVDKVDEKVDRIDKRLARLENRFARLEEKLDMTLKVMREHMASKRDVERMGRITALWVVGAVTALIGAMLTALANMTNAIAALAR